MSLRYKALIGSLLIVVCLTGGLCLYVSQLYENSERSRIRADLYKDAERIRTLFANATEKTLVTLDPYLADPRLLELLNTDEVDEIQGNLQPWAATWADRTKSELSIVVLDSFVAEERSAWDLGQIGDELTVSYVHQVSGEMVGESQEELLGTAALEKLATGVYLDEEPGSAIFEFDDRVFYSVAIPFYDSLQRDDGAVVGIAVVMKELSDRWLEMNRVVPASHGVNEDTVVNPPLQLVFSSGRVRASLLGGRESSQILMTALKGGDETFEALLERSGASERYVGLVQDFGEGADHGNPGFVAFKSLDAELGPLHRLLGNVVVAGVFLALLGSIGAYLFAFLAIRRIDRLKSATVRVKDGDFDVEVQMRGSDEISDLGSAFNDMVRGLRALGVYTDPTLARQMMDADSKQGERGQRETGSIFFSDIQDFTTIAQMTEPDALVGQLNEYFTAVGKYVSDESGYLDKFIGDAVMAFWGKPFVEGDDYAERACRMAVRCLEPVRVLNRKWEQEGRPEFYQRIGIATGSNVIVGDIGSDKKKNFTVIGDEVNLASRLEGANKFYETQILICDRTRELAGDTIDAREVDQIKVKGSGIPVVIHELLGLRGETDSSTLRIATMYAEALALYRDRKFAEAAVQLKDIQQLDPEDGPTGWLLAKCVKFARDGVPDDWEPVTEATEK